MPINVFGNSSNNKGNKIDTSLFVQKPYLRIIYIEANKEEDIDLKNHFRTKILPDPSDIQDACSKNYVDKLFNDPSIIKNNAHIDLNDRNITKARFIQVNQLPQIDSHLTAKLYVDNSIDEPTFVRNNQVIDFGNYNLTNINSVALNTQAVNDNQVITKAYVDEFHQENERSRRDVGLHFYNESSDLVKNNQDKYPNNNNILTNLDSFNLDRNPTLDNELACKQYIEYEMNKNAIVRFNQTLRNYLRVSVGKDVYNLTKYDKIQLTDITNIIFPNSGGYLLQQWNIKCRDKNNGGKVQNFIRSTKTISPSPDKGSNTLPPIGTSYLYIETSSNNHGQGVYCSFERTDIIQISRISLYYNRNSAQNNHKAMGTLRIQLLLSDNTWSTRYNIPKNESYTNQSERKLVNINFKEENYGMKIIYDEITTPNCDMCFSKITITHSVY